MDYFNNLLAKFLSLDRVRILAVYGGSESSRKCNLKYHNFYSEDVRLTGLERHEVLIFG